MSSQNDVKSKDELSHESIDNSLINDLKEYGVYERNNINKEKTRNKNQPYAFLGGGDFGEQITLHLYPNTTGGASKGGMAFDNIILDDSKEIKKAKEVKFISLNGTKTCKDCGKKSPPFQLKCLYCNSEKFKIGSGTDSRASISSNAHMKWKHLIDEYIIFVQKYDDETKNISLKVYKFLTKNSYFDNYIKNQYNSGDKKGGSCNFIPYSYDWFMSGPITIMIVNINISNIEPIITFQSYTPLSTTYDDVQLITFKKLLKQNELYKLNEGLINEDYVKYKYINSILSLRKKNIGKPRGNTTRI